VQIELDAPAILKHPEADGVLSLEKLVLRINTDVEVIKQQIVICAIGSVCPAQMVGAGCAVRGNHSCGEYQEQRETTEKEEFQMRATVLVRVIYRPESR
jgi:hypothetical protein